MISDRKMWKTRLDDRYMSAESNELVDKNS